MPDVLAPRPASPRSHPRAPAIAGPHAGRRRTTPLRRVIGLALAMATLAGITPARGADSLPATVLEALRSAEIPTSAVALAIQPLEGGLEPRIEWRAQAALNPASVMKLVTTWSALHLLGPAARWRTELLANAPVQDGVLSGDLYLRGSGDPKLTQDGLREALRTLRARGVRDIAGDLVLDRSQFAIAEVDPARFDQAPTRPYNVGPDALLAQFKAVRVQFLPAAAGELAHLSIDPPLPEIALSGTVQTVAGPCPDWRAQLQLTVDGNAASARINLSGALPASCGERAWYLGLLSHPVYLQSLLRLTWTELGGSLRGGWREGVVPPEARVLSRIDSPTVAEVIRDINKYSNNVMARQLFLSLSAAQRRDEDGTPIIGAARQALAPPGLSDRAEPGRAEPASAERSTRAVRALLDARGIALPELVLENGSGLSRAERISAAGLVRLIEDAWSSNVMPEFVASMPVAALDGTLRDRRGLQSLAGDAHLKTGSLNDVRAIAGVVQDRTGRRHAIAFLVNHPNAGRVSAAQDALIRWLHDSSAATAPRASSATRRSTRPAAPGHR
jgi:D-alanyl-D-alanine carboxypeptidase/D-alanyl-D-alanine-endopeptidase (penicillin-binding protein 4)